MQEKKENNKSDRNGYETKNKIKTNYKNRNNSGSNTSISKAM